MIDKNFYNAHDAYEKIKNYFSTRKELTVVINNLIERVTKLEEKDVKKANRKSTRSS